MVLLRFTATLTAKVIMAVSEAHVCVSWLSDTSTSTIFLSKATDYFSHMFLQSWEAKYAGKKVRLNRGSNSQPPGHRSDTLTSEPPVRAYKLDDAHLL